MTQAQFEQDVQTVYDWVDSAVAEAGPRCEISGRCCRFRDYGHRLYLTRIEADILFRQPLPEGHDTAERTDATAVDQVCPYQHNGLCTGREKRPLGCRIYFCDPGYDERCCEITEEAISRLKEIHKRHNRPWEYNQLPWFFSQRNCELSDGDRSCRVDSKS
ncbi:hypothetical protein [Rubinisphaera margarita]|uniref:hypothetical protein n=1 Tax=Rubinisphaera margarita TaxID=2909586 RepID=UPI001EE8F3DC|nr:hypothetical protein [Rubinisphaera margarita]MCG6157300.1 hypothetical protein [Rubinisphaera margarita]